MAQKQIDEDNHRKNVLKRQSNTTLRDGKKNKKLNFKKVRKIIFMNIFLKNIRAAVRFLV